MGGDERGVNGVDVEDRPAGRELLVDGLMDGRFHGGTQASTALEDAAVGPDGQDVFGRQRPFVHAGRGDGDGQRALAELDGQIARGAGHPPAGVEMPGVLAQTFDQPLMLRYRCHLTPQWVMAAASSSWPTGRGSVNGRPASASSTACRRARAPAAGPCGWPWTPPPALMTTSRP